MLPAATAACIDSTSDLLELAPEIVRIAARLGSCVGRRSWALQPTSGSWATSISGITIDQLQDAIQQYNETYVSLY